MPPCHVFGLNHFLLILIGMTCLNFLGKKWISQRGTILFLFSARMDFTAEYSTIYYNNKECLLSSYQKQEVRRDEAVLDFALS